MSSAEEKRLLEVARRHRPRGVRVRFRRPNTGKYPAWAWKERMLILSPVPNTREHLFIYLHECAHFHLAHWRQELPEHVMEFEAERWAIATMRAESIAVPRHMLKEAKAYVRACMKAEKAKARPGERRVLQERRILAWLAPPKRKRRRR